MSELSKVSAGPPIRFLSREEAEREGRVYWHSKTPEERWAAAEQLRQIAYGYDPVSARFSPTIEFTQLKGR
jgi:hypothetical protein